jgi:hypothetical protein
LVLLRADLESLSRRHGVTAFTLSAWRDDLSPAPKPASSREVQVEGEERRRLKSVVRRPGDDRRLAEEKIRHREINGSFGWCRSKR